MKILRNVKVPTGNILVVGGERGRLETLSLGDYGKGVNLKAAFMGLGRDIEVVRHTDLLPLEKKWVVVLSPQYGCSIGCKFCDVPKVGPGINASYGDLINQLLVAISIHPEVNHTERLNIHFARMGEPTYNPSVLDATKWFKTHIDPEFHIHPVVSTIMPADNIWLKLFIHTWMRMKNRLLGGEAGLQISINSTSKEERDEMFRGKALPLRDIAKIMEGIIPKGRKITLNFAVAEWTIDPEELRYHFDPQNYVVKLTPMHKTTTASEHGIATPGDYTTIHPYARLEKNLRSVGYDVLVFIASSYEDMGLITCGNAILSGSLPKVPYTEEKVGSFAK